MDPRPRQRDSLADANSPDEETARLTYLQLGVEPHFQAGGISLLSTQLRKNAATEWDNERTAQ